MDWDLYLNFLAAMLAILNPLNLLPIWSQLTDDLEQKARRGTALMIVGSAAVILIIFLVAGRYILTFFSINLPVFQVAGGLLLMLAALSMVNGKYVKPETKTSEGDNSILIAKNRFRDIIVPMAIPMLSGPGSLTTVLLYGNRAGNLTDTIFLSVMLLFVLGLLLSIFYFSGNIEKKVDPIFFNILARIFGILLAAISIQFITEGLGNIFPILTKG